MSSYTQDYLKKIFQLILDRNVKAAKEALKGRTVLDNSEDQGKYIATKGMISMIDKRKNNDGLIEDIEKMLRLKKLLVKQVGSVWSDDFDKGYYETWIKFINFSRRNSLAGGKESVDKNPSK